MSSIQHLCRAARAGMLFALLFCTSAASAGFIFTSQNRFVTGQLGGSLGSAGPQTFTAPASGFALFEASTSLTIPTYGGAADQHQRSELSPLSISVIGDASCIRPAMVGTGTANTRSFTDVSFDLTASTDVTLAASGTAFSSGIPIHQIKLIGPGSTIIVNWDAFNSGALFPQGSGSRSSNFTLAPGSYQFIVDMQSFNGSVNSHSVPNFNVAMTIPEPGSAAGVLLALTAALTTRRGRR